MNRHTRAGSRAFTLVELLVVIGIFLLLLLIAVPAFTSMLYSSEEAMAEQALRGAITSARDAAARGRQGEDAAAVFFYDSVTQKASVIPCVRVGVLADQDSGGNAVMREVFAPANGFEPVQLPRGFTLRGYAIPNSIDDSWYGDTRASNPYSSAVDVGNWVFPETDFYDADDRGDGADRQTFMVRFEGGTGVLKPGDMNAVLVLNPVPSDSFRTSGVFNTFRSDLAADKVRFVRSILNAPFDSSVQGFISLADRRALLGDVSSDTVLAKPVRQIGLVNEKKLASAMSLALRDNIRVDPDTGCLYRYLTEPTFVPSVDIEVLTKLMEVREPDPPAEPIPSEARIFTIHRYLGLLQEITGTINGQGVSQ